MDSINKIIVCLGNPEKERKNNRHNLGYLFYDFLLKNTKNKETIHDYYDSFIYNCKYLIIKPKYGMNNNGKLVKELSDKYKIDSDNIILIFDELEMPFGKIRIKRKGSAGHHNGIKDIFKYIDEPTKMKKIKMGILDDNYKKSETLQFVLSDFTDEELFELKTKYFYLLKEQLDDFLLEK